MVLLENEAFLAQLAQLYSSTKSSGTVYTTLKRYNGQTRPKPRKGKKGEPSKQPEPLGESRCLFRATDGKKKLSTIVMHKDVNKFQLAYANLLKTNIDNLKKRDRKKAKKTARARQELSP